MNIIIVGATTVGIELAEYLVHTGNAVTLIDEPSEELTQIGNRLDLRVVQGDPTWPSVLREAGARNAEMLVSTSDSNEKNIAVCSVAAALFRIPRKIARIRSAAFLNEADKLFCDGGIPIDHIIAPEHIIADAIIDLIELPGVNTVHNFTDDRMTLLSAVCSEGGKLAGSAVSEFEKSAGAKCVVTAVYRKGKPVSLSSALIYPGDEVFVCCERSRALSILNLLIPLKPNGKQIVIEGGSHIADELALRLSERYQVKLIEPDPKRAARITDHFKGSEVELYNADALSMDFVLEEKLYQTDIFIAASPVEETNIMSSMMVQRFKKVRTVAVIRRDSLREMAKDSREIDAVVSPRDAVISALLSHIRQGGVEKIRIYSDHDAEAMEFEVCGDRSSSYIVGRHLVDINLPEGVSAGLVLRDKIILKIDPSFVFKDGDRVLVFLTDRSKMRAVTALFRPKAFWFRSFLNDEN